MRSYKVRRLVELEVYADCRQDAEVIVSKCLPQFNEYEDSTELLVDLTLGFLKLYSDADLEELISTVRMHRDAEGDYGNDGETQDITELEKAREDWANS